MSILYRTIGPPGCGKTTWLARQCLQASQKYGGSSIAIASLTRTAAAEIASRSTGVPRENIGTLHSHAFRQLKMTKDQVAETTSGIKGWNETCRNPSWELTRRSVANPENATPDERSSWEVGGDQLLSEVTVLRAKCIDPRVWPNRLQGFWKAWTDWKGDTGRLDFTDMIEKSLESVDSLGAQIVMLDEAQDMSLLEMRLARKWGMAAEQLLVVGDPDQTIYEWRGSDPSAFYEGEAQLTQTLAQSYRVPREVHRLAVEWIGQIRDRESVEYHPRDDDGKVAVHHQAHWRDPDGMLRIIERMGEDGSTVAVLSSCAYMLGPLATLLKDRAVPFHNPYRPDRWEWNPINGERLLAFTARKREGREWNWREVWKWAEVLKAQGIIARGGKSLIEAKAKQVSRRLKLDEDETAEIVSVLNQFEIDHQLSVARCDIEWWQQNLMAAHRPRQRYACELVKHRGIGSLQETPRLSIGTIHSYKGGEADKVVLIPDLSRAGAEAWHGRGRDAVVRQFYVGITRARRELHVVGNSGRDFVTMK